MMPDGIAIAAVAVACFLIGYALGNYVATRQAVRSWQRYLQALWAQRGPPSVGATFRSPEATREPDQDGQEPRQPREIAARPRSPTH